MKLKFWKKETEKEEIKIIPPVDSLEIKKDNALCYEAQQDQQYQQDQHKRLCSVYDKMKRHDYIPRGYCH